MKASFLRFERFTTTLAMALACAMMATAASLGFYQIITRFILESPSEWSEVIVRFSLIWMVFLGIPTAFRIGAMVSVDVLYRWSSARSRRVLDYLVCAASLALISVIIVWGWDYARRGSVQSMIGLEDVSMFWAYLSMPVGGVFSAIAIFGYLLEPTRQELETQQ